MSKVSVILTSYNRPNLVRQAIDSVRQQDYQNWQLIVVDDGSSWETQQVLIEYQTNDKRIHGIFCHHADGFDGCRYARNINWGLERATGELVTYLTDDDYYLPQRLSKMVEVLDANPDIHIVYGNQRVEWLGYNPPKPFKRYRGVWGVTRNPQCRIDHNSFMHRKSCLDKLTKPYWPEDGWMNGDAQFFDRLVEHWDFHPIEEILDVHRWHPNNVQERIMRGQNPIYESEI